MSIMRTAPTGERHVEQEARLDGSDLTTGALDRMVRGGGLRTRWRRRLQPFLLASDVGVITLGLVAFSIGSFPETLAVYVGALLTLSALGAYRSRLTLSVLDDVPALVSAALVGAVAELVLRTVVGSGGSPEPTLLRHALAVAVLLVVSRAIAYLLVREARRRGLIRHRTLILGSGAIGRQIAEATLEHPECGLRLVGFLDSAPQADQADLPVPAARRLRRPGHLHPP